MAVVLVEILKLQSGSYLTQSVSDTFEEGLGLLLKGGLQKDLKKHCWSKITFVLFVARRWKNQTQTMNIAILQSPEGFCAAHVIGA